MAYHYELADSFNSRTGIVCVQIKVKNLTFFGGGGSNSTIQNLPQKHAYINMLCHIC